MNGPQYWIAIDKLVFSRTLTHEGQSYIKRKIFFSKYTTLAVEVRRVEAAKRLLVDLYQKA